MKVGRRLAIKILNVSKFVLGLAGNDAWAGQVTEPLDKSVLANLADVVQVAQLHVDEASWLEPAVPLWLWALVSTSTGALPHRPTYPEDA